MRALTKMHPTNAVADIIWHGVRYLVPLKVIEKYKVNDRLSINDVFGDLLAEQGEAATLLKGLRHKEGLTQVEFADAIQITQANLSAMENGRRAIGKEIAKRIAEKFGVDYRLFL